MHRLKHFWDRQTFASQLISVFLGIFCLLMVLLGGVSNHYFKKILTEKIRDSFQQTLRQTGRNVDTTLAIYKDSVSQLVTDSGFLWNLKNMQEAASSQERAEEEDRLEDRLRDYMTYQSDVRFISVKTKDGLIYSFDRMQNRSIYRNVSQLHEAHFDQGIVEEKAGIKGIWIPTEYLDRVGTKEYYVYTFGKQVYDWNINQYMGSMLVSMDEERLSEICVDSQISSDPSVNSLLITDQNGMIVSYWDKSQIGKRAEDVISTDGRMVFREHLPISGWTIISLLDNGYIFNHVKEMQRIVFLLCLLLGVLAVILITYVSRRMAHYVKAVVATMNEVEEGKLSATVGIQKNEKNEINLIGIHFNAMMDKINEQMAAVKKAGQKEKEAEIRALEAQINPHFIYNTLDSINWVAIENGQDEISDMLSRFAQILRYQIQKSNVVVSIEEELKYLEKYLFLQKNRFMDSFEYVIECQETVKDCQIHKMIFQPFIENSILHGCADLDYGGLLKIQVRYYDEGHIKFVVADNGTGMSEVQIKQLFGSGKGSNSIGISNVLARLKVYYGEDYSLMVDSAPGKGTKIEIIIPRQCSNGGEDENINC